MIKVLLILFLFCSTANAATYVQHKDGKILGLSSQQDMVLEDGAEITKLKEDMNELGLVRDISFYEFKSGKIKLDTKKVIEQENKLVESEQKKQKKASDKASVIDKLKTLGLTDDEIAALIGGE